MAAEPKTTKTAGEDLQDKPNWRRRSLLLITVIVMVFVIVAMLMDPRPSHQQNTTSHQAPNIQKFRVSLSEKPLEIKVPLGMRIGLEVVTKDVPFWVRVNYDPQKTDHYPPINSPEYHDKDYGEHLRCMEVWLDSGYQAEVEYYFKPL